MAEKEYIDREALKSAIYADGNLTAYLNYIINRVPTANVQPVRHGRWLRRECGPQEYECKCSECEYRDFMIPWHDNYWFNRNYCPNCGAKMEWRDQYGV